MFIISIVALIVGISTLVVGTPLDMLWTIKSSMSSSIRRTLIGIVLGTFILILGIILLNSS